MDGSAKSTGTGTETPLLSHKGCSVRTKELQGLKHSPFSSPDLTAFFFFLKKAHKKAHVHIPEEKLTPHHVCG